MGHNLFVTLAAAGDWGQAIPIRSLTSCPVSQPLITILTLTF